MRRTWWAAGLAGGLLAVAQAGAADPDAGFQRLEPVVLQPPAKDAPKAKEPPPAKEPPATKEPAPTELARTDPSAEPPAGYFTRMMGDALGFGYATETVVRPGYQVVTTTLTTTRTFIETLIVGDGIKQPFRVTEVIPIGTTKSIVPVFVVTQAQVPILSGGGAKISENEMPSPEDRFILSFNGFFGVNNGAPPPPQTTTSGSLPQPVFTPLNSPVVTSLNPPLARQVVIGGAAAGAGPTTISTIASAPRSTVYREVVGFEKTILDGAASVGVRAPLLEQYGGGTSGRQDFGDLTFVFKALAWSAGPDAVSLGLAVTAPTGPAIPTPDGDIHSTLLQPFVGGRVAAGDLFATGFTSVVIPVDSRNPTILFNDLQLGWLAYQSGSTWVAPVTEAHLTTPLKNSNGLVYVPETVVLTQGIEIGLGPATLNLGVAIPVSGQRPFDWEGVVQLDFRY